MSTRRAGLLTESWRVDASPHPRAILFGTRIRITDTHNWNGRMTATAAR
jgi:hypothetical protein